jgi:hypothetical protein
LLHQDFDPNEASTEVYEVDVIDTGNWKAQQTVGLDWRRLAAARVTRVMQGSKERGREGDDAEEREKAEGEAEDDEKGKRDGAAFRGPAAGVGGAPISTPELPAPPLHCKSGLALSSLNPLLQFSIQCRATSCPYCISASFPPADARGNPSAGGTTTPAVTGDNFEPQDHELVRRYMVEGAPVDLTVRCFDFAGQEVNK